MMLCFPEHCTSFSGLNVVLNVVEGVYIFFICSECIILYKYQFDMSSSDTKTFKVTSHILTSPPIPGDFYAQDEYWIFSKSLPFITLDVTVCCLDAHRWLSGRKQYKCAQPRRPDCKWQVKFGIYQPFRVLFKSGMFFKRTINGMLRLNSAGTIVRNIAFLSFGCGFHMWASILCNTSSDFSALCLSDVK